MSIFDEQKNYKPFKYGHITDPLINAMWAGHWTVNEFSFISDINDFKVNLNDREKEVFKKTMLLISQIEVAVKSYWSNIRKIFPRPEIADMGSVFGGVEVIHSRAYSEILNVLGFNDEFQNILTMPVVNGRVSYLNKYNDKPYTNDRKNAVYSLILFTLFVENVSLFSQFYIVLAFNRFRGLFKDVANVVQYTSKEENLHAEGGMALINQVKKEHPEIFDEDFNNRIVE
jgi:ribonucleoside-diphosphate reductase beta chain